MSKSGAIYLKYLVRRIHLRPDLVYQFTTIHLMIITCSLKTRRLSTSSPDILVSLAFCFILIICVLIVLSDEVAT